MEPEAENRNLPLVALFPGTTFYADAVHQVLIDTEDKNNTISVLEMVRLEDHYEFLFDCRTRNLKKDDWRKNNSEQQVYVWLRPLEVYDVEGAKIRDSKEILNPFAAGKKLPEIDLAGVQFLWDREHTALLQKDNPYNQILPCSMDMRGEVAGIYFDKQKKVVPFPHEIHARSTKERLSSEIIFIPLAEINKKIMIAEKPFNRLVPKRTGKRI